MLRSLFPRAHLRYLSMPVLGPIADGFDDWLAANGYTRFSRQFLISALPRVDVDLRRRQVKEIANLTHAVLHDCWRTLNKTRPWNAGTVGALERYLAAKGLIADDQPATANSPASILIEEYANHLREVRGLGAVTVLFHRSTAESFLQHLDEKGVAVKDIDASDVESYVARAGTRLSRASLQNTISALRGFLRFLAIDGRVPDGLGSQIDTPRLYRLERLPRALPWDTVRALLRSIDRTSATGLRDYAMFLLMATYGLRASEVVAITLDDIHWREGRLRIHPPKTSSPLELPLTNEVSSAVVKHLKRTPPPPPHRRIFLRVHAPIGVLKAANLTKVFYALVRKSGLGIPLRGPHCLRHSLAVHLLKSGTPFKTVGDILGHRSAESTSVYLRLATEDLREVPLPVPAMERQTKEGQR
ncbi:MAG: site-specific integrase [Acidobacteria bacterium]|nr:site-specific integrase [Acidobacteriota bacterium]